MNTIRSRASTQSKGKFGARVFGRSSFTERAMKFASTFKRTVPRWPGKARQCASDSSRGGGSWYWLLACLLLGLCAMEAKGNPMFRNSQRRDAEFSKQQLYSRYNFTCIQPTDGLEPHEKFLPQKEITANSSLTDLKNDLIYIKQMAKVLKLHKTNESDENRVSEMLPEFPSPLETEPATVTYQEAFNQANNMLMHYLNGLARIEGSLIENAQIGDRFFNLTEIETHLADWLHDLHMRMVQQKMQINCDGIRQILKLPNTKIAKPHQHVYITSLMRKFINVMEHVLGMFNKAIHHENEVDRQKKDEEKKAAEWNLRTLNRALRGKRRHMRHHRDQSQESMMILDD